MMIDTDSGSDSDDPIPSFQPDEDNLTLTVPDSVSQHSVETPQVQNVCRHFSIQNVLNSKKKTLIIEVTCKSKF